MTCSKRKKCCNPKTTCYYEYDPCTGMMIIKRKRQKVKTVYTNIPYSCCQPCYPPNNYCHTQLPPQCPEKCPENLSVAYVTNIAGSTTVPSGGSFIPDNTIIVPGSTSVPSGTVTVITGYTGTPSTNVGGIVNTNGFLSIPVKGKYTIIANICFGGLSGSTSSDERIIEIYKVNGQTGLVSRLAIDSRPPVISSQATCINVSASDDFKAADRVFISARQTSSNSASVLTIANTGRLSIVLTN